MSLARTPAPDASSHRVAPDAARPWHAVGHRENFPVASLLVPRSLRPAIVALYRFARHADDIADEGEADTNSRERALDEIDQALEAARAGRMTGVPVVDALPGPMRVHAIDWQHLHHLVDAFRQDLRVRRHADPDCVQRYCDRSANPVGRMMLTLFGAATPANLARSDAICSALQRINFLQDVLIDRDMDRVYLPLSTLAQSGIAPTEIDKALAGPVYPNGLLQAIGVEALRARNQMLEGAGLVADVPLRLSLELRFIVAGGLRILERLAQNGYDPARGRPVLGWRDGPALLRLALAPRSVHSRLPGSPASGHDHDP